MEHSKLQIGCLMVVLYLTFMYIREKKAYGIKKQESLFGMLLAISIVEILFDGVTAYTVNHLTEIPDMVNRLLHVCFLCSLDVMLFVFFLYVFDIAIGIRRNRKWNYLLMLPLILNLILVISYIPQLEFRTGVVTNYSMGVSAYTCFIMVFVYMLATFAVLFVYRKNMGGHKMITIMTYIIAAMAGTVYQMFFPEALTTSLFPTIVMIGTYLNIENPLFMKLHTYNQEMVMGFSTLVENRDGSTGGHIRRTTEYVRILAKELRRRGFYKNILTKDYIKNLVMAAPMHDVGKIAIPDAILQKPGRLTEEEYDVMKTHAARGSEIIQDTFGHLGEDEYEKMAYEVARYHHEKWNGNGYPEGLSKKEIPLCARIMAVADVFDAVSADRCYRKAMPVEACFAIIKNGSGLDFDPLIVEVFLDIEDEIRVICESNRK